MGILYVAGGSTNLAGIYGGVDEWNYVEGK